MTGVLEIWFGRGKKIQESISFAGRKVVEQLASKKCPLSSNFVIIVTKFADFFGDIYDAFFFEIRQGDENSWIYSMY